MKSNTNLLDLNHGNTISTPHTHTIEATKSYNAKDLLKRVEKAGYAHNCPKRTGWLTPVSQELIESPLCDEDDVIEYIETYLDEPLVLVTRTKFGWYIQKVEWSKEPSPVNPSFSLTHKDWFKIEVLFGEVYWCKVDVEVLFDYFR